MWCSFSLVSASGNAAYLQWGIGIALWQWMSLCEETPQTAAAGSLVLYSIKVTPHSDSCLSAGPLLCVYHLSAAAWLIFFLFFFCFPCSGKATCSSKHAHTHTLFLINSTHVKVWWMGAIQARAGREVPAASARKTTNSCESPLTLSPPQSEGQTEQTSNLGDCSKYVITRRWSKMAPMHHSAMCESRKTRLH